MRPDREAGEIADAQLLEALRLGGCAVCTLAQQTVRRYLQAIARESITDVDVRALLREALGFCPRHAWQWLDSAENGLGTALVYQDLAINLRRALASDIRQEEHAGKLMARMFGRSAERQMPAGLSAQRGCPSCEVQTLTEQRVLDSLLKNVTRAEIHDAYAESDGLCLPHLHAAMGRGARRAEALRQLKTHFDRALERLEADLAEFIRKQDYRYQHEPIGPERDAPSRAIGRISGERGAL
jgi:hypothetical protein